MKKIFLLLTVFVSANLFSQVIAPNFGESDIYGNEYYLYDELDLGKPVILNFFGTS